MRPKPIRMLGANSGCTSRNSPSSTTCSMTVCMSYGRVRRVGDERVELEVLVGERVGQDDVGRGDVQGRQRVEVVARQVGQQRLDVVEGVGLVLGQVVGHAGLGVVRARAAELLERDLLAGDGLHDVGAGDEHLAGLVDHHDEVGERGGVDVPAGGRAHHQGDLRDDPGGVHVALEDLAVEAEGDDALLDPRAAALVDPDHRAAVLSWRSRGS